MDNLPPIDRAGLLVLLAPLALLPVVVVATLVRLWRRPDDARRRSLIRATLVAAPVLAGGWLWFAPRELWIAQWTCRICGEEEMRLSWDTLRLEGVPSHLPAAERGRRYNAWYLAERGGHDEHDWRYDFERGVAVQVSCESSRAAGPFYSGLPLLPDQEIAQRLLQRLVEVPPEDRHELMRDFEIDRYVPNPVRRIAYEGPMEEGAFRAAFFDWLEEHPPWR